MTMEPLYSELELSAVQEIANIGTGNAATALSQLIGRPVDIGTPAVELVALADAAERIGPLETIVAAVLTPMKGDAPASMLLALPMDSAQTLCGLLGTDATTEMGRSCLQEIGNILTSAYATAMVAMTGLALEPEPPLLAIDMLGAVVDGVLAASAEAADTVLFLRTAMSIEGAECSFGFLFVPHNGSVATLLRALGLE
jgi:chemotaxis protein CheC